MKRCLADVNVLLPLLVATRHHDWRCAGRRAGSGRSVLCRFVQLALVRLLGNRTIMGKYAFPLRPHGLIAELMEGRAAGVRGGAAFGRWRVSETLRYAAPTTKLVGDAYLRRFLSLGKCG